ncbi:MAG TPA: choline kinase family protein [Dongiaceae bacterium]|nr:choline kinase family protein [Dongiaceae bacterium]
MAEIRRGDATSADEAAVEAALLRIPQLSGQDLTYERISAGITNANWRIRLKPANDLLFLKVPGKGTELFIDRRAAHDANMKAAQAGVGPRVLHYLEDSGVEVFEYLTGYRSCNNIDFRDRDLRLNALAALKRFHEAPPLSLTKTYFDMIEEHRRQIDDLSAALPRDWDALHWQYGRIRRALDAAGLDLVPCINDTYVTDFMANGRNEVKLVDFEYASNNDRCADLAIWFYELFFPEPVEDELIEAYFGACRPELKARIAVYKVLISIKWTLWASVQRRLSALRFDYAKYGAWLNLRGRFHLRDWRWESYLRAL